MQPRSGCLLPSVTNDIPEYSIVRTCTLRLLPRAISLFPFSFLLLSYCLSHTLYHIPLRLEHSIMDDNSAPVTNSPLPTQRDANGTEADQHALVLDSSNSSTDNKGKTPTEGAPRDFRFWAIIASLCITGLLSALENTVVTTSLPTIVRVLNLGDNYIWITNVFFLTRCAIFPRIQFPEYQKMEWLTSSALLSSPSLANWPISSVDVG